MPFSRRVTITALGFLLAATLFVLHARTLTYLGDTDRWYHFAVSRMLAESHSFHLETVPQAEDVGWGRYFPDKEFLFHVVTSTGYRLAGERGTELAVLAVAAGVALLLFGFALCFLTPLEAFACAFAVYFTHSFASRMVLVRPHVLAVFFFVLLNAAVARRHKGLAAFAAAGYALAYHAFYVPLFAATLVFALARLEKERRDLELLAGAVLGGLALGLVLNPYFPSNIAEGIQHAMVPFRLQGSLHGANFGMEAFPLNGTGLLKFFYFPFLIVLGALAARVFRDFPSRFLLVTTLVFAGLTFVTVRAGEHFVPAAGLLLPLLVAGNSDRRWIFPAAAVQLAVLVLIARTEQGFVPDGALYDSIRAAVAAVPPGPAKVFNCEWDSSPFIFQTRPDLRFVDLLDPTFLFEANPGLFRARVDLAEGKIADPRGLLHGPFHADYALCRTKPIVSQLEGDAGFDRLYPRAGESAPVSLYRVRPEPDPAFVRQLLAQPLTEAEAAKPRDFVPGPATGLAGVTVPEGAAAVVLGSLCTRLRVDPTEVLRHRGAAYLGAGGTGAIRAWRNGRLLFSSGPAYARSRSVQALVRLDPPLGDKDSIDLLYCSGHSAAVSLWTPGAARALCAEKARSQGGYSRPETTAPYSADQDTCFGILASPPVPPELRP